MISSEKVIELVSWDGLWLPVVCSHGYNTEFKIKKMALPAAKRKSLVETVLPI